MLDQATLLVLRKVCVVFVRLLVCCVAAAFVVANLCTLVEKFADAHSPLLVLRGTQRHVVSGAGSW